MKNWNKTGKIKAIILVLFFIPNLIEPNVISGMDPVTIVIAFIFGVIVIPLLSKLNAAILGRVIEKPSWNDNPLRSNNSLSSIHFSAFFFLTLGLSLTIGTGIKYQTTSYFGLTSIALGLGMLIGIWLTLKWTTDKVSKEQPK